MPFTHTNRKGDVYTLYEGRTKTGKPKYYMASKPSSSGQPLDALPEGYEIREGPASGTVSVRRFRPRLITDDECRLVREGVEKHADVRHFIVDGDGDAITVYVSNVADNFEMVQGILGIRLPQSKLDDWAQRDQLSPEMRFILIDADKRLFAAERWCYRGSIDDWFPIGRWGPLPKLVEQFTGHLGRESFYELM